MLAFEDEMKDTDRAGLERWRPVAFYPQFSESDVFFLGSSGDCAFSQWKLLMNWYLKEMVINERNK